MRNLYNTNFFQYTNYIKCLNEIITKIEDDKENAALYIQRAEIHQEFNNEISAISDLLIANHLDKNNIKIVGTLMILYFDRGEFIKSHQYKVKYKLLEHQLNNNNCGKISIHNLLNKENYVPNIQEQQQSKNVRKY